MFLNRAAANLVWRLFYFTGLTGLGLVAPAAASAQSTNVWVQLCQDSGSYISVTAPPSDSTVTVGDVRIEGQVGQSSQIDVSVDGAYDHSLALAPGSQTFLTEVRLAQGTHTVRLTALDSCQKKNNWAELVLTYQPAAGQPVSPGQTTPTSLPGLLVNPGQPIINQPDLTVGPLQSLRAIVRGLDFDHLPPPDLSLYVKTAALVTGGLLAVLGGSAGRFGAAWLLRRRPPDGGVDTDSISRGNNAGDGPAPSLISLALRLAGLLMIATAFLL